MIDDWSKTNVEYTCCTIDDTNEQKTRRFAMEEHRYLPHAKSCAVGKIQNRSNDLNHIHQCHD